MVVTGGQSLQCVTTVQRRACVYTIESTVFLPTADLFPKSAEETNSTARQVTSTGTCGVTGEPLTGYWPRATAHTSLSKA